MATLNIKGRNGIVYSYPLYTTTNITQGVGSGDYTPLSGHFFYVYLNGVQYCCPTCWGNGPFCSQVLGKTLHAATCSEFCNTCQVCDMCDASCIGCNTSCETCDYCVKGESCGSHDECPRSS